jgi:hypothetical protein
MDDSKRVSWQTRLLVILLCIGAGLTFKGLEEYSTGHTSRPRNASEFWRPEPVSHGQALEEIIPGAICTLAAVTVIMVRYLGSSNDSSA